MGKIKDICQEVIAAGEKATQRPWRYSMLGGGKGLPNEYGIRTVGPESGKGPGHIATVSRHSGKAGENAKYVKLSANHADKIARASLVMEEALKFYRDEYNWLKGDSEVCSAIIADTGTRAKSAFAQVQEILK